MTHATAIATSTMWADLSLTLAHSLWQGAALTVALWAALKLLPAARPNARYVAAMAALLAVVVSATVTWHVLRRPEGAPAPAAPVAAEMVAVDSAAAPSGVPDVRQPARSRPAKAVPWELCVGVLWMLGASVMLFRAALSVRGASSLRRRSRPLENPRARVMVDELAAAVGVARRVRVGVSDALRSPAVVGVVWPTVLLPTALVSGLPVEHLRAVLAHELAHVRRYDYLAGLIQMLIEAAGFFNPAVWWISRQVRTEREACCDAVAAAVTGPGPIAQAIAGWAERPRGPFAPAPAALARGRAAGLLERLTRIVHPQRPPAVRLCWYSLAAMLIAGAIILAGLSQGTALAVDAAAALLSPQERVERVERAGETYGPVTPAGSGQGTQVIVSGVVRTHDGKPLDGKRACLWFHSFRQGFSSCKAVSQSRGFFGKDGRFRVPVEYGEVRVEARSPGYALASAGPFTPKDGKVEGVELVLTAGFTGRLRLVDPDGKGIAGACPSFWYASGTTATFSDGKPRPVTDANGMLPVPDLADRPTRMVLRVDGFQYERRDVKLTPDAVTTIRLVRARPVTGRIVSAVTDAPVAGATVKMISRFGFAPTGAHPDEAPVLATSDAQGRFAVTTLRDDSEYDLFVSAAGHGCVFLRNVKAGREGLQVKLGPELYVRGRVTGPLDKLTRVRRGPSVGCDTHVRLGRDRSSYSTHRWVPVTIREGVGHFKIRGLWPGTILIGAGGRTVRVKLTKAVEDLVIDLSDQSAARPRRAVVIKLDVPAGAPSPKGTMRVGFTPKPTGTGSQHLHELLTIDKGVVRVEVAAPGGLRCTPEGTVGYWFKELRTPIDAGAGPVTVNVPCAPAGAIYGQVFEADGSPANLVGPDNAMVSVVQVVRSPALKGASASFDPGLTSGGRFFASPLPLGGTYRMLAHRGDCCVMGEPIVLDGRSPTRQVRLKLVEGISFPVKVRTPQGKPAVGVPVSLIYETGHRFSYFGGPGRRTDAEGKVVFEHVNVAASGGYQLRIAPLRDYRPVVRACHPSADGLTVKLEAGLTVSGRVIHADTGRPIPDAKVFANAIIDGRSESISADAGTDAKGRFRFSTLGPGVYRLRVSDAHEDGEHTVDPRQRMGPWAVTVRVTLPSWSRLTPAPLPAD